MLLPGLHLEVQYKSCDYSSHFTYGDTKAQGEKLRTSSPVEPMPELGTKLDLQATSAPNASDSLEIMTTNDLLIVLLGNKHLP